MSETIKQHVIAALRSLMKPIIMMLLRNGVTYKEFALLCKSLFVEAAAQDYGLRGRPTNVSRIAVLTGIDRKEVKRIKDLLQENKPAVVAQQKQDRMTRILSAWYQDEEFCREGEPMVLPVEGGQGTFTALAKRYGGDVPVQALLKEMVRLGLVSEQDQQATVLSRYFFPAQSDPESLIRAGSVINELGETLYHNLYVASETKTRGSRNKRPRFERRATNNRIDSKYRKAFYDFVESEGQAFLERVDHWLSEHEAEAPVAEAAAQKNPGTARFGVAVFGIDKTNKLSGESNDQD